MTADATNLRIIGQMRKLTQGGRAAPRSVPEPLYWEPELLGRRFVVVVRHIDVLGEPRCPDASEVDSLGLADDDVLVPLRPCGEDRVCEYVSSRVEFRRELRNNLWELITYERRLPVEWPWPLLSVAEGTPVARGVAEPAWWRVGTGGGVVRPDGSGQFPVWVLCRSCNGHDCPIRRCRRVEGHSVSLAVMMRIYRQARRAGA